MTDAQLAQLIAAVRTQGDVGAGAQSAGAAAVVGPMRPCPLGKDKLKIQEVERLDQRCGNEDGLLRPHSKPAED